MIEILKWMAFLACLAAFYVAEWKKFKAFLLTNRAFKFYTNGQYRESYTLFRQALQILQHTVGERHPRTLNSLSMLAECLDALGRPAEALPHHERCLALRQEARGEKHHRTLDALNSMAECLDALGRSSEALPQHERCLALREEFLGEKHPDTLVSINNMAVCLDSLGRSVEALPQYQQCFALTLNIHGEKHQNTIASLNNLAHCLGQLGRSSEALPQYERCLALRQEVLGEKHPLTLNSINNLAICCDVLGRSSEALSHHERCLALRQEVLGEKHPATLDSINNLAQCRSSLGRSAEVLPQFERCLALRQELQGEKHPDTLSSLNNLAVCLHVLGRPAEAVPWYQRCVALRQEVLGEKHPNTLNSLENLALCLNSLQRSSEALLLLLQSLLASQDLLGATRVLPDEIRRSYIGTFKSALPLALSLAFTLPAVELPADILDSLYMAVLRQKLIESELHALPQEAVLLERYPQFAPQLRERTVLQQEYSHLYLTKPLEARERIDALERRIQQINTSLIYEIPELREEDKRLSINRRVIALSLPTGSALVEYVHYRRYDFVNNHASEERYAAFGLTAGEEGTLHLINLGEAVPIDALVQTFRYQQEPERRKPLEEASQQTTPPTRQIIVPLRRRPPVGRIQKAETPIEQLVSQIWKPLLPTSMSQGRLFVVPDGQLGSLPFELIAQQSDVTYLAQATDLPILAERQQDLFLSPPLLIADPDYGIPLPTAIHSSLQVLEETVSPLLRAGSFACGRLPGSYLEALRIQRRLHVHPYLREEARTSLLTESPRPSFLHLSTHGFSMEDLPLPKPDANLLHSSPEQRAARLLSTQAHFNPMLRCGIAFAGARDFLAGRSPEGVLNAQDFTGFDLRNTRIILSCCSTAATVKRDGRGLLGLRTALFYAGGRTLILTLWKVDDLATGIFMEELYRGLFAEKRPVNDALPQAKRYLRSVTIGQLKQTFWLNGEAKEALRAWKQSHPAIREAPGDDVAVDILVQRLDELAAEEETRTPFAAERYWAPFVCYGDTSPFV